MFRLDPTISSKSAQLPSVSRFGRLLKALSPVVTALCLSSMALGAACGGDDSDDSPAPQNSGGKGGSSGAAAGSSGSAGSMAFKPPPPVACGSTTCSAAASPLGGIASMFGGGALASALPQAFPCCLDESSGSCGIAMSASATCEPPAVPDTRCPAANLGMLGPLLGANSMAGCCIDNQCGQDGRIFGGGCIENSAAKQMIASIPLIGGMLMVPAARACDAPIPDAGTGDDAGASDLDAGK